MNQRQWPWAAQVGLLAVVYFFFGKLASVLATPPIYPTPLWPAAGVALAGVLLGGNRVWPGVWLGSTLVNVGISLTAGFPAWHGPTIAMAAGIGAGAALQAVAGATLVRQFVGFPNPLTEPRAILKFLALGGPVACVLSPTTGTTALVAAGRITGAEALWNWFAWWVGDTIGVLVMVPVALAWLTPTSRRRQAIVTAPLAVTFALVVAMYVYARDREFHRLQVALDRQADDAAEAVRCNLEIALHLLWSVDSLFASLEEVTETEFQQFVRHALDHHAGVRALSWNRRVADRDRAAYEAAHGPIVERAGADLVPAGRRDEYFPITYAAPPDGPHRGRGFDTASDPRRRAAMLSAWERREPVGTELLPVYSNRPTQEGWVVYLPVHRNEELQGFVALVMALPELLEAVLPRLNQRGVAVQLQDRDGQLLFATEPASPPAARLEPRVIELPAANHNWALRLAAQPEFVAANRSWQVWAVLVIGLLFTGLLGALLLVVSGQTARVEELVAQRTAEREAAEAKLRASEQLAATGQMAARLAHEINNPLAGIRSAFLLIKDAVPATHPHQSYVPRIEREIDRIAGIVRRVLDLHRPAPEQAREFVLQELIGDVVTLLEPRARAVPVQFETALPPHPLRVRLPETGLSQVLFNLLENAVEASPPNSVVRIAVAIEGVRLTIRVRDEGPGVPAEARPHLFEPFFTTKAGRPDSGLGIGLSVSRALVESLGGSLTLADTTGPGTTFAITLPWFPPTTGELT